MFMLPLFKSLRLVPFLALPLLAWLLPGDADKGEGVFSPEKVNLALRRTADGLLRISGDSTSRIPAIEYAGGDTWRVLLEQPFGYEELPALLQASFDQYGIRRPYEVAVRRCDDATIDLGFHQKDYLQNKEVPCGGRDLPEACRFIEVTFLENSGETSFHAGKIGLSLLFLGGLAGIWFFSRQKTVPVASVATEETDWLSFGNSRLDVAGQVLVCGGINQQLTFRETKLLRLFATNPDKLLERDDILRQVWADEGVMVGRSVDVFVSRLRKKLAADPSVGIAAVHGVGYRLETGKLT